MFLEELEKYLRKIIPHIDDTEEIQESIRADLEESLYQALVVSYLLGWDHIAREEKIEAAEKNPFYIYPEGAVKKLIKRVSMSREQFYELDAKARFKAFTVSWVTSMDAVKKVKSVIASSMVHGESIRGFVERVGADEIISQSGFSLTKPWYWEVVYRTNVIAAYNAGRFEGAKTYKNRIQYLTFIAILDERTTDICRSYDGITRPVDDPIWEKITPPNHFQCRSTVRAVWKYEKDKPKLTSKKDLEDLPIPQEGFDASPVDWWKVPKEMMKRAAEYGVAKEIKKKEEETRKKIKKTVEEKIIEEEKILIPRQTEKGIWFDENGNIIHTAEGTRNEIRFLRAEEEATRNAIFTHNHPRGSSFSPEDIYCAMHFNAREMRACDKWYTYSMKRMEGKWDRKFFIEQVKPCYDRNYMEVAVRFQKMEKERHDAGEELLEVRKELEEEFAKNGIHEIWERVSKELGLDYSRRRSEK
ncbi:MAG: minor capsid protein [Candidatus Atribacteria bacterium]|nr:minor capsid protein [Candidatus Atribacteria bacterium]